MNPLREKAIDLIEQLEPEYRERLMTAIRQLLAGDKDAVKRLVEQSERELNELKAKLMQGGVA